MNILLSVAVSFLPLILATSILLWAVDKYTVKLAFFSLAAGFGSLIPIALFQSVAHKIHFFDVQSGIGIFISALVINGLIEEFFKMLLLLPFGKKKLSIKILFICSITAGFAIGSFESLVYLAAGTAEIELRLITAAVIHAACAGLSGLYVWGRNNGCHKPSLFISAAVLHGLYNFFAGFTGRLWWYSIAVIIYTLVHIRMMYKLLENNQNRVDNIT